MNDAQQTTKDLSLWSQVELPAFDEADDMINTFQVGLFGMDLTAFFYDCYIAKDAEVDPCPYDDLKKDFDGWAVGGYVYLSYDATLTNLAEGVCFGYTNYCFGFYTSNDPSTASYYMDLISFDVTDVSASSPDMSGLTDITAYLVDPTKTYYGFNDNNFWTAASNWKTLTTGALFYRYQRITQDPVY